MEGQRNKYILKLLSIKMFKSLKQLSQGRDYKNFRWFFTSDNKLVVGGKSEDQNELVLRNFLKPNKLIPNFAFIKKICSSTDSKRWFISFDLSTHLPLNNKDTGTFKLNHQDNFRPER